MMFISRELLWKNYRRLEKSILPNQKNPQHVYKSIVENYVTDDTTTWLDLGCGHKLFPLSLSNAIVNQRKLVQSCKIVCGLDGDYGSLKKNEVINNRIFGDINRLPFGENNFDLVTANMVVEHLEDPDVLLSEVNRVLKPDGVFIIHTSNTLNYKIALARMVPDKIKKIIIKYLQNRAETDVFPTHYRLNTVKKHKKKAKCNGFKVESMHLLQGPADSVMLGPIVIIELLIMKLISFNPFARYRSNIISVMRSDTGDNAER